MASTWAFCMVKRHAHDLSQPFAARSWPAIECPDCERGALLVVEREIDTSKRGVHVEYRWHPDDCDSPFDVTGTFVAHLRCSHCGFVVGAVGEMYVGENPDYRQWNTASMVDEAFYRIKSVFPPLLIAEHPSDVPPEVVAQLRRAGALVWSDASAAMTALRTSVEALLTVQGVPSRGTAGRPLTLDQRIKIFHANQPDLADLLHAARVAGNLETHGDASNATIENVLEIVDYIEITLDALYTSDHTAAFARVTRLSEIPQPRSPKFPTRERSSL
ncbi:DUF4145 domain-containing protein [Rhodococcoides fascians]|uniref:DUF4145 domain-containing protein n=1 Tax=Rhodococcoides fascians TaxID=1828 RepID=UPI001E5D3D62|nr:DUF4145 domain-containing protein [Rhodococcus fascians]